MARRIQAPVLVSEWVELSSNGRPIDTRSLNERAADYVTAKNAYADQLEAKIAELRAKNEASERARARELVDRWEQQFSGRKPSTELSSPTEPRSDRLVAGQIPRPDQLEAARGEVRPEGDAAERQRAREMVERWAREYGY